MRILCGEKETGWREERMIRYQEVGRRVEKRRCAWTGCGTWTYCMDFFDEREQAGVYHCLCLMLGILKWLSSP